MRSGQPRRTGLLLRTTSSSPPPPAIVFVGTLYPLVLELVNGAKITVGAPYFNQSFLPVFGLVMFAAGIGPFLSWKRARPAVVLRKAAVGLAAAAVLTAVIGLALVLDRAGRPLRLFIALWLGVATLQDLAARVGAGKAAPFFCAAPPRRPAALGLGPLSRPSRPCHCRRRRGCGLGLEGRGNPDPRRSATPHRWAPMPSRSRAWKTTLARTTRPLSPPSVSRATARRPIHSTPERRFYPVQGRPTTEAGIVTLWHGDIYAVLGDPDDGRGRLRHPLLLQPGSAVDVVRCTDADALGPRLAHRPAASIGAPTRRLAAQPAE